MGSFSILTLALAFARNYEQLLAIRFLDGLALGGVLPVIWTLNTEYAPKRFRASIVTIIMLGYSLGGVVAGPIARLVLPRFDWPGVFVVGAAFSFVVTLLLIAALPESIRFLVAKSDCSADAARLLRQIGIAMPASGAQHPVRFLASEDAPRSAEPFRISRLF